MEEAKDTGTADRVKAIVAAALTFATLTIPGFSDLLHSAGGQAEVLTLTGALYLVISGVVHYVHGRVTF